MALRSTLTRSTFRPVQPPSESLNVDSRIWVNINIVDRTPVNCRSCGAPFIPRAHNHVLCHPGCGRRRTSQDAHKTRTRKRDIHTIDFVGVDGEGVTDTAGHHYVLLSVGDQSLYNDDGSHLTWDQIFRFIYSHFHSHPTSSYVGFFLGYDFTQWLRSLPAERAAMLLTKEGQAKRIRKVSKFPAPFPVDISDGRGRWEFDILGAVRFKFRPRTNPASAWCYVCDTGGFWQCSFLTAIDPKTWPVPIATDDEYAIIKEGKEKRATAVFDADMIRYNVVENRVLGKLMTALNRGFVAADIRLNRNQWFGPGQAASAWLDNIEAPTAVAVREAVPEYALDIARQTYYGGWFEISAHGHIPGRVFEYDINSAYPHIISQLPCLLHGTWSRGQSQNPNGTAYRMMYVTAVGDSIRSGVMPFRSKEGLISRPQRVEGWYWQHELEASKAAGFITKYWVHEWVAYTPCACPPPLAAIADLYQDRITAGKNSPQGKALKLVYNSAYGKFAQSIGTPKYANSVYASLITAGCRTQILDAIATHETKSHSLVMVATDAVYFREPHMGLELSGTTLGGWDSQTADNMTLVMPGIYWSDKTRDRIARNESPNLKSRGINAADLGRQIGNLDQAWRAFDGTTWPKLTIPVNFAMTSAKQAIVRGAWETAGTITTTGDRELNSHPGRKRCHENLYREHEIWRTTPWVQGDRLETTPYDKTFGAEVLDMGRADEPITLDANAMSDVLFWALRD